MENNKGSAAVGMVLLIIMVVIMEGGRAMGGNVYKVGDSAGWTTIGNVDYKLWAATKSFQLGDIIVFTYNKQFHNVMQVKHGDYRSCNTSAPISTHSSGNDSFVITTSGHHFFLCAVPGHCQAGQRLDINVQRPLSNSTSSSSAPTPSTSPSTSTSTSTSPSPVASPRSLSKATRSISPSLGKLLGFAIAIFAGIL